MKKLFCFCLLVQVFACNSDVLEKEFLDAFRQLSDQRIQFRKNMKALGDSSYSHRKFTQEVLMVVQSDTLTDLVAKPEYKAYSDSLRDNLRSSARFFEDQYKRNKPIITQFEKTEMHLDRLVEDMKDGDLSEKAGLDSMRKVQVQLRKFTEWSDSLVKASTQRYWDFRKTLMELDYNQKNLQVLYAQELFQLQKKRQSSLTK